jgi:hypothetical protein
MFARALAIVAIGLLLGCQGTPAPKSSAQAQAAPKAAATQEQKFGLCDLEGFRALNTARQYLVIKDSKERILSYLGNSQSAQAFASDFFTRIDAKTLTSHTAFAAESLLACAAREELQIGKPKSVIEICYARADIPFFLNSLKSTTPNKADCIAKVRSILKDPTIYPDKLIAATADVAYGSGPSNMQQLMGTVFWSCVYNDEWSKNPK